MQLKHCSNDAIRTLVSHDSTTIAIESLFSSEFNVHDQMSNKTRVKYYQIRIVYRWVSHAHTCMMIREWHRTVYFVIQNTV